MSEQQPISISQLAIYNPQRTSDSLMKQLFIARKKIFAFLMKKIQQEKPSSIPQHHLIIALRGMGKSTLLKRIEIELRQNLNKEKFVPLLFPEEQYNLSNLAEFWLNCLDTLADTLEIENQTEVVNEIDKQVNDLKTISNTETLARKAHQYFKNITSKIGRRPVLLLDNLNLVFNRLSKPEQHTLRAWLMQNNAPILIGASAVSIEDIHDYKMPFYDAFQMHYLQKLNFKETIEILQQLARLTKADKVLNAIYQEIGRLKTIYHLTGGNPRTVTMLFRLIIKGFSKELNDDLEALLEEITPLYKARFEVLSDSQQKIIDAIALHWNPINLGELRNITRLENNQISPQLKRLREVGWIESLDAYKAKGKAYQISERFFNIWFLMRRSSRRQKRELLCLSKFLESFYGERLSKIAQNRLDLRAESANHVAFNLAIVEVLKDKNLKEKLRTKSYEDLEQLAKNNSSILEQFDIKEINKFKIQKHLTEYAENLIERHFDKAENALISLINITNQPLYFNLLGDLYQRYMDQYKKAEQKYQDALKINKNYLSSWIGLGELYQKHFKLYEKAEDCFLNALKINTKSASSWCNLGNLYQNDLYQFDKSEEAYLNAIKIIDKFSAAWNGLGNLYQRKKKFVDSEKAYLIAIQLSDNFATPWNGLGNLYQNYLEKFDKSEEAYLNAIEIDKNYSTPWNNLGNLYQDHLAQFEKAKNAYLNAIKIDNKDSFAWNGLGNLYQNCLNEYEKAKNAYETAIELDEEYAHPKYNLVFLFRDKLNQIEKAKNFFDTLTLEKSLEDSYYLHKTLFALYDCNEGIAYRELSKAFDTIEKKLPPDTQDDWMRFAAICINLNYGQWLQKSLQQSGHDIFLAPYFIAIKAINEDNPMGYLYSKAVEIREPAKKIIEMIRKYMD